MGKRILIKTPAARSNSSEGTRKGIEKKLKSLPTERVAWCATCEQGSNEEDRDAPPGETIKVKWIKFRRNWSGRMVPKGQECYPCFYARRKFWADKNQKALNRLLKHNSDEKDTHAEARRAKVCKDKKYKGKEEIKFTTTKTKAAYGLSKALSCR